MWVNILWDEMSLKGFSQSPSTLACHWREVPFTPSFLGPRFKFQTVLWNNGISLPLWKCSWMSGFFLIFFFLEGAYTQAGEGQRQNPKQAPRCQCRTRHEARIHKPRDRDLCGNQETLNWLTQSSPDLYFSKFQGLCKSESKLLISNTYVLG